MNRPTPEQVVEKFHNRNEFLLNQVITFDHNVELYVQDWYKDGVVKVGISYPSPLTPSPLQALARATTIQEAAVFGLECERLLREKGYEVVQ